MPPFLCFLMLTTNICIAPKCMQLKTNQTAATVISLFLSLSRSLVKAKVNEC